MTHEIPPSDLDEIATILARGYLRQRDSLRRRPQNCLASAAERSVHVPVVNEAESSKEMERATGEKA